jgi:nucleoside-diphosphate-sugar epimerase
MKVIITGGGGFLGQCLAREILRRGALTGRDGAPQPVEAVVLADIAAPPAGAWVAAELEADPRVSVVVCDISRPETAARLVPADGPHDVSVFHLSAVMSGQGETDFDLALAVNLDGTRHLLQAQVGHSYFSFSSKPMRRRHQARAGKRGARPDQVLVAELVIHAAVDAQPARRLHLDYSCTREYSHNSVDFD